MSQGPSAGTQPNTKSEGHPHQTFGGQRRDEQAFFSYMGTNSTPAGVYTAHCPESVTPSILGKMSEPARCQGDAGCPEVTSRPAWERGHTPASGAALAGRLEEAACTHQACLARLTPHLPFWATAGAHGKGKESRPGRGEKKRIHFTGLTMLQSAPHPPGTYPVTTVSLSTRPVPTLYPTSLRLAFENGL